MANSNTKTNPKSETIRFGAYFLLTAFLGAWIVPAILSASFIFGTVALAVFGYALCFTGYRAYQNGKALLSGSGKVAEAPGNLINNDSFNKDVMNVFQKVKDHIVKFLRSIFGDFDSNPNHPLNKKSSKTNDDFSHDDSDESSKARPKVVHSDSSSHSMSDEGDKASKKTSPRPALTSENSEDGIDADIFASSSKPG